ncbi:MAG: 3-keto-5-aminohexanoate cleavage protein [Myxococcales bacterium]|nr:3-keto-5-aminohexanoate cleavage protein [Myxococcales bacterium]
MTDHLNETPAQDAAVLTCALTGVLTDPARHPVPVTPEEMATAAKEAFDAGASIMHVHFRQQGEGMGRFPSWEPDLAETICEAIRQACPGVIINMSTGVIGPDVSAPLACLERVKPEIAACNAGTLNYLKTRSNGQWAWPPMVFDNPVEKVQKMVTAMDAVGTVPEFECFDVGILRSIQLYVENGWAPKKPETNLVMGVASGMPADPKLLEVLVNYLVEGTTWQTTVIGRQEVWDVHQRTAELGGHLRTGVEDTFYLPNGDRCRGNGDLVEALANTARNAGRAVASPAEARQILGLAPS